MLLRALVFLCCTALLTIQTALAQAGEPVTLTSPNGDVTITVSTQETLDHPGPRLFYAVSFQNQPVLLDAPFALGFKDSPPFARHLSITHVARQEGNETWQRAWGKRKEVVNHYREMTLTVEETQAPHRRIEMVFRAYDDGAAFRYVLPEAWGAFKLAAEHTPFRFPGDPTVWAVNYGGYASSQEAVFREMQLNELEADQVYGLPMLVHLGPSLWAALTEANLTDWAGTYFTPAEGRSTLVTSLSPRLDEPDVAVRSTAPRRSPWRLVMVGRTPGAFIESDLVQNLNDPPAGDFSWVQPGKASWNWWNGPYLPEVDFEVGMNTATMKHFVDLAAEMNWEYVLVDAGWYQADAVSDGRHGPASNITAVIPALEMPELIRYAHEHDVKVVLWMHWRPVLDQMDKAFPLYEQWGISGVKIDFMDRDDQEMVNFYHRTVKKAAEHHLLVDFHGAYKPTGWSRTYPNLITREGVLGNEYNKWSALVTPEHTVTIPFTRGMLGEMDFTPGGFRNMSLERFHPQNMAPFVMGTRARQLAMLVVFESALQVLADSPYNYRSSPAGTDFLKIVPTTWDDTKVLDGHPGDYITVARRSGDDWYLGSMSDEEARTREISLGFLGAGRYRAEIWADAYEAADFPDRLMKQERIVTAADTLTVRMAPGGGLVARLTPVR